jgi:ketosteroid isomerase-like protein
MSDPCSEIRHVLARYQEAQTAKDLATLEELHWQDERFVHTWSPGEGDRGWDAYSARLRREFESLPAFDFDISETHTEVFGGKFAVVTALWSCQFKEKTMKSRGGPVTFVLSMMGSSWRIVADHFSGG